MTKNLKTLSVLALVILAFCSCRKQDMPKSLNTEAHETLNVEPDLNVLAVYTPGTSYKYYVTKDAVTHLAIEYIAGDATSQLILAAPHGGSTKPTFMKTRTADYVYGTLPSNMYSSDTSFSDLSDAKTMEMAKSIADTVRIRTGKRPHLIINYLHRSKLDANRRKEVATQGGIYAAPAWDKFHEYIDAAKATINANHTSGLYLDIHGQAHTPQRTELGYLLSSGQLTTYSSSLGSLVNSSSVKAMVGTGVTHTAVIKGVNSLGTLMNNRLGYMVTPSQVYPMPGDATIFTDGEYFNGGYNSSRHGSKHAGTISAIQIEFNQDVRLTDSTRPGFAGKTARAIQDFMTAFF